MCETCVALPRVVLRVSTENASAALQGQYSIQTVNKTQPHAVHVHIRRNFCPGHQDKEQQEQEGAPGGQEVTGTLPQLFSIRSPH